MVTAAILVVIALWLKRLVMVSETSHYDQITRSFGQSYQFTWVSISITLAGVAAIPLLLMLLFRVVPILAIDEVEALAAKTPHLTHASPMPARASHGLGIMGGVFLILIAVGAIGIGGATPAVAASHTPATVIVTAVASGPKIALTATVKVGSTPVVGALVKFYESTTMFKPGTNRVPLGKGLTDLDGIAEVNYVAVVNGPRTVSATYYADVEGEPAIGSTQVDVTGALSPYVPPQPELLAGIGRALVSVLFTLVLIVFILIIAQVVRVRRSLRSGTLN